MSPATTPLEPVEERFPQVTWFCALSPFVCLLLAITVATHIRLGLGHWPTAMDRNYHAEGLKLYTGLLQIAVLFATMGAGPLWLLCLFLPPLRPNWPDQIVPQLATCTVGWILLFAFVAFDPTGLATWFD